MDAGPRNGGFSQSDPPSRDSASACAMSRARCRSQLSSTTSKSPPSTATARSGTLPSRANLPRPSNASRASTSGSNPTWSWPLLKSLTTSTGVLAAAGTALVSGQRAAMADATAAAMTSAPGRASSVTTTRCLARYAYHWRYGEWPGKSTMAAPSSDTARSLRSLVMRVRSRLEHVEMEEVRHDVVGDIHHVADAKIAGDAAEKV